MGCRVLNYPHKCNFTRASVSELSVQIAILQLGTGRSQCCRPGGQEGQPQEQGCKGCHVVWAPEVAGGKG